MINQIREEVQKDKGRLRELSTTRKFSPLLLSSNFGGQTDGGTTGLRKLDEAVSD